jgi:DNA-binding NarL/FixJ family response regulator
VGLISDRPVRVIVAEDDDNVRALVGIVLGLEDGPGFVLVGEAHDGREAVTLAESEQPDAIVLDLMMPVMGGLDAIPAIRERSPETKIVVFSAVADANAGEALARGADAIVQKTDLYADLTTKLHEVCVGT